MKGVNILTLRTFNKGKSNVVVIGEFGTVCDVIRGARLVQVQLFNYLGCVVNKNGTDNANIKGRKVLNDC